MNKNKRIKINKNKINKNKIKQNKVSFNIYNYCIVICQRAGWWDFFNRGENLYDPKT